MKATCTACEKDGLKMWRYDRRECKAIAITVEDVFTTRTLARTRYEAFGATEGFEKDERGPRMPTSSQEKLSKIQQKQLRVSEQWHCQNARAWPEAFKSNVGG